MPVARAVYLTAADDPVYAVIHPAAEIAARDTAIVISPPFGWEETCSYRIRREWAMRLAQAGYATVRPSFPGTGDSGGYPREPALVEAWTDALAQAAGFIRKATGTRRTVAIGMGLGGLLAYRAAAGGAAIDDLVLWATPARGRSVLRQLRAFSKLEMSQFFDGLKAPAPLPPSELEAGGFLMSEDTVGALGQLDLTELPIPAASSRRVLLLDRDGISVDSDLLQALKARGAQVSVAPGNGYGAMTSHPQQALPPLEVMARVNLWLGERSARQRGRSNASPSVIGVASTTARMRTGDGQPTNERPFAVPQPFGDLAGVLTQSSDERAPGPCVLLLNAGAVRRIGPSRMWVEAARRWSVQGVPVARLDVEGIGDADGEASPYAKDASLYVPTLIPQVLAAVDFLDTQGAGDRFVLGGLCAGAYWAFHAALLDARVCGGLMINPRQLIFDRDRAPARDFRALLRERHSLSELRAAASARRVRTLAGWMLRASSQRATRIGSRKVDPAPNDRELREAFARLGRSEKRMWFLFSCDEPLDYELTRSGVMAEMQQRPNMRVDRVAVRDHTLRPNASQAQAHALLDRTLAWQLQAELVRS